MKKINFHFHTIYSDGKKTVEQIAELVNKDGLDYLAITDHDTVNAIDKLKPLLKSTELINGIELTAQVRDNLIFHILGIGFDHKKMLKHLEAYGKKYNEEYQFYFDKFTKEKNIVDISTDKHKVKSAWINPWDMINEFKEKGYIKSKEELPAEMLSHGLGIKVKDVIDIIHECGGKAIWAHPYIVRTYTDLRIDVQTNEEVEEYLRILLPLGIDGLEARYHHFTDKQRDFLLSLCGKYCLMHTVGTDFHGKDAASSNILCEEVEDLECDRIIKNFK